MDVVEAGSTAEELGRSVGSVPAGVDVEVESTSEELETPAESAAPRAEDEGSTTDELGPSVGTAPGIDDVGSWPNADVVGIAVGRAVEADLVWLEWLPDFVVVEPGRPVAVLTGSPTPAVEPGMSVEAVGSLPPLGTETILVGTPPAEPVAVCVGSVTGTDVVFPGAVEFPPLPGNALPRTVVINADVSGENCRFFQYISREMMSQKYERTSQNITPPFHCFAVAVLMHLARSAPAMKPLLASGAVAGLPMTSLFNGTPAAAISKREDLGFLEDDVVIRPSQVLYSVAPSAMCLINIGNLID